MPAPVAGPPDPLVSLLMVARNAAAHIDAALASCRRQSLAAIEIVVVDDGSTDATAAIIARHAAEDARVIPVRGHGKGLAAVRNLSIAAAAAPWAAIIDSDDILHPRHVEALLGLARSRGADMAAANMIAFGQDLAPALFAAGPQWARERMIGHIEYLESGRLDRPGVQLGYLKPLLRLEALRRQGIAYDLRLRIGEDWDMVERALAAGLTYAFAPEPTYYYRRHPGSVSFRWQPGDLAALIAAERDRLAKPQQRGLAAARRARLASLEDALAHCEAVGLLKARAPLRALAILARRPRALGLLGASVREGLARRVGKWRARGAALDPAPTAPLALLCGDPEPGSPIAIAAALAEASGCVVVRLSPADLADPLAVARSGRGAALVLLADTMLADRAAHAIGDGAPFVAAAGAQHPLIDLVIDQHSCGALLELIPKSADADAGLLWRERARRVAGLAA
ncbi:glycosyltransferase family 2 protein [Erythrobacter donghaensis]|jgi:succinoglycan biosynthesis protein ExoO|uniref:glycosyltransferase family 2 protein n=1 Tax=Erythrobacter donghaensis TaxID=267135 RepID=UPI00093E4F40|nr:glycosyltransferase family 2 protein [Erythrobacter donghaensis]